MASAYEVGAASLFAVFALFFFFGFPVFICFSIFYWRLCALLLCNSFYFCGGFWGWRLCSNRRSFFCFLPGFLIFDPLSFPIFIIFLFFFFRSFLLVGSLGFPSFTLYLFCCLPGIICLCFNRRSLFCSFTHCNR